jgi:hypothetical protein
LLHTEVLEQLRSACSKERELQPLLREFRSLIYQGLQHQAIDVLRKIRAADPDNSSWKANLQTMRKRNCRIGWIGRSRLSKNADMQVLREIFAELTHPWRVVQPPPDILKRLQRSLLSEKATDLLQEAENVLNGSPIICPENRWKLFVSCWIRL